MTSIAPLREHAVELAHAFRQIAVGRRDHRVIVIAHQAISVAHPVKPRDRIAKDLQKPLTVFVILVYGLAPIAARSNVV